MLEAVDGRGSGHRVPEDAIPLAEDETAGDRSRRPYEELDTENDNPLGRFDTLRATTDWDYASPSSKEPTSFGIPSVWTLENRVSPEAPMSKLIRG